MGQFSRALHVQPGMESSTPACITPAGVLGSRVRGALDSRTLFTLALSGGISLAPRLAPAYADKAHESARPASIDIG
jgi:hypothetical protein